MRSKSREGAAAFVMDVMRRYGGVVTALRKNAFRVKFRESPPFADSTELVVALERKALGHYPDAALGIPGSPFYFKLVDLARSRGKLTKVYTPLVEPLPEAPPRRLFAASDSLRWRAGDCGNHPHIVFNFAISYHSVVTSDDLVSIGYDVVREAYRDPRVIDALHAVWSETLGENPCGWKEVEPPDLNGVYASALEELNRLTRRKVARARKNTQKYLDREIRNVEEYYRQLISEEKQFLSRLSQTSPEEAKDHERKIRRYQLDWKRRTAEEVRHHRCRVNIRLVSAAHVVLPRTAVTLKSPALANPEKVYFNHFLGTVDGLICGGCQGEFGPWRVDGDSGGWICRECLSKRNGHPEDGGDGGRPTGSVDGHEQEEDQL